MCPRSFSSLLILSFNENPLVWALLGGRIMRIFVLVLKQDHMALSSLCSPSWPLFIIPLPQPDEQKEIGQESQTRRLLGIRRVSGYVRNEIINQEPCGKLR